MTFRSTCRYTYILVSTSERLMSVVSVKVPPRVKEEMRKVKDSIKWSEEIRNFILDKLQEEARKEGIKRAEERLGYVRKLPKGSTAKLIREDRDSRH